MPTMGTASAATGVISMVLLSAVVVLGILLDRRVRLAGLPRFAGLSLHRFLSLLAVGFLAVHILTAVIGPYARIRLAAIVVPFASGYARGWLALGTVATDLLIALVATSLLRRHLRYRTWRAVHWLAYACWPVALAHSLGTGNGIALRAASVPGHRVRRRSAGSGRLAARGGTPLLRSSGTTRAQRPGTVAARPAGPAGAYCAAAARRPDRLYRARAVRGTAARADHAGPVGLSGPGRPAGPREPSRPGQARGNRLPGAGAEARQYRCEQYRCEQYRCEQYRCEQYRCEQCRCERCRCERCRTAAAGHC